MTVKRSADHALAHAHGLGIRGGAGLLPCGLGYHRAGALPRGLVHKGMGGESPDAAGTGPIAMGLSWSLLPLRNDRLPHRHREER